MAQTTQQAGVKESVVVRAAEIEVLVLDSKGRPVTDLRRDEFLLTVDGRPRKIDWVLPPPARKGEVLAVQEIPVDLPETPSLSPPPALPHSTVFFVDDMHLDFRSRYMGLRAIEVHANTLPPEEEIAVYTFRRRLEIVQRFTTDRTEVTASVKRLGGATPVSFQLHGPGDWVGESQVNLQALSQMLTTLSGRPEPKTVILLGGYLRSTPWGVRILTGRTRLSTSWIRSGRPSATPFSPGQPSSRSTRQGSTLSDRGWISKLQRALAISDRARHRRRQTISGRTSPPAPFRLQAPITWDREATPSRSWRATRAGRA